VIIDPGTLGEIMTTAQERLEGVIRALTSGDTLGGVIRLHLYIEHELNIFISSRLPTGVLDALQLTYSKKINLALTLGLAPDLKGPLKKIGKIRNDFAHNLDHILTVDEVDGLFDSFGPKLKEVTKKAFDSARAMPSGARHPATHHELDGASKMQLYVMQIWTLLAHFNDSTFNPRETIAAPEKQ
jgi:hypothetical protein